MFLYFLIRYDGMSDHQGGTDGVDGLCFVTGAVWHRPRGVRVQVRRREPARKNRPPPGSGGGKSSSDSNADAAARKLTSQIKDGVRSATELLHLLDGVVDGPIFNYFHASAAYHSLATKWKRGLTPSDKASPVLLRLAMRVQKMTEEGQVEPRAVANVLYSLGKLSRDLKAPEGLLMALVKSLGEKASGMKPQELSNILLAFVELKGVAPAVLTALPELAAQISIKAKDMGPQALSNSLWASAHLKDDACGEDIQKLVTALVRQIPDKANGMKPQELCSSLWAAARLKDDARAVLQMVPALVEEIPRNQADFSSQQICNGLEALVLLRDSVKEVDNFLAAAPGSRNDFVGFAASRFSNLLPESNGKALQFDIPLLVWACARVNFYHEELLVSTAQRLKSGRDLEALPDWGICALLWSYDVLDPDGRFAEFKNSLASERVRRGLSDSDVSESQQGHFDWNQAKS